MGMAAFRVNEEERQAIAEEATEKVADTQKPEPEPESPKTTTVATKKPAATSKG